MTTAYYDHLPPQIEAIGNGSYFYRWNIKEEEVSREMTEETTTQWKCNEVVFEPPMSVDNVTALVVEALGTEDEQEIAAIRNEVGLVVIPLDMEAAKKDLQDKILAYDSSVEVNSFTFAGVQMWLDKATRVGLKLRFEAEVKLGKTETTLWLSGMGFTLPLSGEGNALDLLDAIELYASASYDVTQQHLAQLQALGTAEEILAFDFTSGYPEKLVFG